ncbi:MAG: hypothetical protein KDC92_11555 [Bacteroidetes bacterium]|nr:hypothetical protein [Bacteroidota bacterium]
MKNLLAAFILVFLSTNCNAQQKFKLAAWQNFVKLRDTNHLAPQLASSIDSFSNKAQLIIGERAYLLGLTSNGFVEYRDAYKGSANSTFKATPKVFKPEFKAAVDSILKAQTKNEKVELLIGKMIFEQNNRKWTPTETKYYDRELEFEWKPGKADEMYGLHIKDASGADMVWERVKSNKISLKANQFLYDRCYYWQVEYETEKFTTDSICFYRMNLIEASVIQLKAKKLQDSFMSDSSAFGALILAQYYESEGIQHLAHKYYKQAVVLGRNHVIYRRIFKNYLQRAGNFKVLND